MGRDIYAPKLFYRLFRWNDIHLERRLEPFNNSIFSLLLASHLGGEDKSGIRGLLTRYLGDRGFQVDTAGDGEEAFRKVIEDPPDVMLLDLYLPRLNGHDLLRRMQEMNITIELIFTMSGYAQTSDAKECLRLGAIDHLLKPIDLEHLHRSILLRLGAHPA